MRIGIDFDNTIACYDGVFHTAAIECDLITPEIGTDKNSVRDFLNGSGQKDAFTELQGYVYGSRMDLASPYAGVADFIAKARARGDELFIISHKTRHPMMGPKHDMHEAARGFLQANGLMGEAAEAIPASNVFFEVTKEDKIARAATLNVDVFIDDLPSILTMSGYPEGVHKILFDPHGQHAGEERFERVSGWSEIAVLLSGER